MEIPRCNNPTRISLCLVLESVYIRRMNRRQLLDLYFLEARGKLVDLAAFLDRVERAGGEDDFRLQAFRAALTQLTREPGGKPRAESVLLVLSDPTVEPLAAAPGKGAAGAWPGLA